ncbi:MAG: DHH family phosphoesterase [Clostridia bacterium]|nr:DHH family phosphoesterase [Clostridia bacterium]
MKQRKIWNITPLLIVLAALSLVLLIVTAFWNWRVFAAGLVVTIAVFLYVGIRFWLLKSDVHRYLGRISSRLNQQDRTALESTPIPVAIVGENGEVVWYNELFRQQVLQEKEAYGKTIDNVFESFSVDQLTKRQCSQVACMGRSFSVFAGKLPIRDHLSYVLYCFEDTQLRQIAKDYEESRPVVLSLYIDNGDEIMQNLRDSERAQLSSQVETLLEDWVAQTAGIFRKCGTDRFLAVLEYRHLQSMIDAKFDILDRVRTVQTSKGDSVTLSVGVGTANSFYDAEYRSRQALDMALGRGGDQAAIKTVNGFDFYGGLSKSVEKQTRVRSRVVASALRDMILNSDNVLLMGHRYSDLDCLGAAVALTAACRHLGKPAYTVYDPHTTLAKELVARYTDQIDSVFITEEDALPLMTHKTLLIITDTHSQSMLDAPEIYRQASSVVIIDHHRKMVEHIDDAVIFYHEPYSSSASEMVAELVQYMAGVSLAKLEAEALLAGIMLDTRSFVMKAGVRTFEAAAYLRKCGADTVEVKRLFSENISLYQRKAEIISTAQWYSNTAIAHGTEGGPEMRIAASQAADELLCVKGVDASFAMFPDNGGYNISARSYGDFNVQLVMEALGGGGHQTMAGAFLKMDNFAAAENALKSAIDAHRAELLRSRSAQK